MRALLAICSPRLFPRPHPDKIRISCLAKGQDGFVFLCHADLWIMPTSLGSPLSQAAICPIVSA